MLPCKVAASPGASRTTSSSSVPGAAGTGPCLARYRTPQPPRPPRPTRPPLRPPRSPRPRTAPPEAYFESVAIASIHSVGAPLKLPRCIKCILNGPSVTSGEVSDNHHVLGVSGRDAEGPWKLAQYRIAVVEVGTDHHMPVV